MSPHASNLARLLTHTARRLPDAPALIWRDLVWSFGELDARVDAFARKLAAGAPQAIRYTKVSVNLRLKEIAHTILDASMAYEMLTFATQDHREAVSSFLEKRKPAFTGK